MVGLLSSAIGVGDGSSLAPSFTGGDAGPSSAKSGTIRATMNSAFNVGGATSSTLNKNTLVLAGTVIVGLIIWLKYKG